MNQSWNYIPFSEIVDWQKKSKIKSGDGKSLGKYKMFACSDTEVKRYDENLVDNESLIFGTGGKASIHYCNEKFAYSTDCVVACKKNDINVNLKFYYYYFRQNRLQPLQKDFTGSGLQHTSKKKIGLNNVPIPPLEEQRRIVTKIEELFSKLDNAVETLQIIKKQLAVYKQAVLKEAYKDIHNYKRLETISERIFDGPFGSNLKTIDYTNSGIRVIRLENLKNLLFDNSKQSFITKEKYETIKSHTIYPSDIVMSTFIAGETKVCQITKNIPFAVNKADCIGIRLQSNYIAKYILYYLSSKKVYQKLSLMVHGATRPRVNTKQIKSINIPVCSIIKQQEIIEKIETRLSVCDNIEKTMYTIFLQAETLRQSILKQAFEGKLI